MRLVCYSPTSEGASQDVSSEPASGQRIYPVRLNEETYPTPIVPSGRVHLWLARNNRRGISCLCPPTILAGIFQTGRRNAFLVNTVFTPYPLQIYDFSTTDAHSFFFFSEYLTLGGEDEAFCF